MKQILTLIILFTIFSCNTTNSEKHLSPEELKLELKKQEQFDPVPYLTAKATMTPNSVKTRNAGIFHSAEYKTDGYNVVGTIKNTATMARYKDVVLSFSFLSQTQTVIETKEYILYNFYEPNSTKAFSLKVFPPSAMNQFNINVINASAAN